MNGFSTDREHYPVWVVICIGLGISAPVLFLLTTIIGGALRPGYSHVSQAISELTQAGAADKAFLDPLLLIYQAMGLAFGVGMYRAVRGLDWRLRGSAGLLAWIGLIGFFFYRYPMDPIGQELTFDGRIHLVIVSCSAIGALLAVAFSALGWGRTANARGMAWLSWAVLSVMILTGLAAIPVATFGWPGMGLWQRANTSALGLWQIVTAVYLLRHPMSPAR